MRKFFAILAAAFMTVSASAQEPATGFYGNKLWDNWYLGLNAGIATKTTNQALLKNVNPNVALRVGKWLTPYFGIAAEGEVMFSNRVSGSNYTDASTVKTLAGYVMGQFNLTNAILGYEGTPRKFELIANVGIGPHHNYTGETKIIPTILNTLNQRLALDFAWNFGKKTEWQFFVEPSITYAIAGAKDDYKMEGKDLVCYDVNYSFLKLNVGINYYFRTSNGTHRFMNVMECDQNEIDALNANIADLRNKNAADDDEIAKLKKEINDLKKALKDAEDLAKKNANVQPNLPSVFYELDKTIINKEQAKNVAIAAAVMKNHPELKVAIKGYASPEGPHDHNDDLSVGRAKAVKDMLVKKFGIEESRISTEGCGETDQLFEIYELNRVAMLYIVK